MAKIRAMIGSGGSSGVPYKAVTLEGSVSGMSVSTDFVPTKAYWYPNDYSNKSVMLGMAEKNQGSLSLRLNASGTSATTDVVSVTFGQSGITYTNLSAYASSKAHTMVILGEMS